jgi:eukaryotic-like serine/threonine-protein kinase
MSLSAGTRLGPYEAIGPLGSGGMGEVYRARDTRLGREVAIKVLPADRLSDEHRRARFVREARAASALNHPNIVTIHEIDSAGDVDFIVMELVPGETLARILHRGALPTDDALRIAIPVADALAAAHAAGIVHRDLKPSNVMVTPDGTVKVLDFGLVKLVRGDAADSDEATATVAPETPLSRPGAMTGTAGYMSPEQATGRDVDARSDIFTFGVLLYEMVTGRRAFAGDSSAEAIAALLKDEPRPPSELAPGVPKELERIIARCLRKDPGRRFQHTEDVRVELEEVREECRSPAGAGAAARGSRRRGLGSAAAVVVILASAAALMPLRRNDSPSPALVQLTSVRHARTATFSPDGVQMAFAARGERGDGDDIWLKIVGEVETRLVTTGPSQDLSPAWSPDGKRIAFLRDQRDGRPGTIHVVSPLGGPGRRLSDLPAQGQLSWSPDGRWLAAARPRAPDETTPGAGGIHLISAGSGASRELTFPEPPAYDRDPAFSPDGQELAYASCGSVVGPAPACDVVVVRLDADARPRGAGRRLTGQRFVGRGLAWTHDGRSIVYGAVEVYLSGLYRVVADGSSPPARVELAGREALWPFAAPNRDRLGFLRELADYDIHRFQPGAGAAPLVASTGWDYQPQYSPDGRRIAFSSNREGETTEVWVADADGSSPARVTRGPGRHQGSPRWSPDGGSIAFDSQAENGRWDVWTIGVDGSGLRQVTRDPADENVPSWSHDGRWIYFGSNRTGRWEVWRVPAAGGSEEPVTSGGGYVPLESFDGRTLYYRRASSDSPLLARPTTGGTEQTITGCVPFPFGYTVGPEGVFHLDCTTPTTEDPSRRTLRLWEARTRQDRAIATLDTGESEPAGLSVSPDGRTILYTRGSASADLMMIENFR